MIVNSVIELVLERYFTLAQPILLHRTHMNETQYLQKYYRSSLCKKLVRKNYFIAAGPHQSSCNPIFEKFDLFILDLRKVTL